MIKILCVCGARPNFMKIAPLMDAFASDGRFQPLLVHTGQHYDENMSRLFFDNLGIVKPDINLEVGSGTHAEQTAEIMRRFEPVVQDFRPDYVLVVGDVNSTIACSLVAVKLGVDVIHVEAGLRSFDRSMPEEINRVLTDAISELLFVTEQSGLSNLLREGVPAEKVHLVGNVMIDTLISNRKKAAASDVLKRLDLEPRHYGVVTLHRPSNVDDPGKLDQILEAFYEIQWRTPLVFPVHPRTKKMLTQGDLAKKVERMKRFYMVDPLGYLDFLCLIDHAYVVLTDSGGIQDETTILGVPCLTLRENTERPVTLSQGTNRLVEVTTEGILESYERVRAAKPSFEGCTPPFWDGKAAARIVERIVLHNHRRHYQD